MFTYDVRPFFLSYDNSFKKELRVKLHHYDEVIESVKTKSGDNETSFNIPGNG